MTDLARTPRQLGAIVRNARKKLGLTQSELGERTGLRQETISLIENGNPATKLDTLLNLLAVLGLEFQITARSRQRDNVEDLIG
jgi:HTH-type transcriptional regulator / antitoxin HipB